MRRFLPWLMLGISFAIVVVALAEVSSRQGDGVVTVPTAMPSPTFQFGATTPPAPPTATPLPITPLASPTGAAQFTPAQTTPGQVTTPPPTQAPTFVPSTPAPTPAAPGTQVGPQTGEPTPVTGGGAVPGGLAVLGLATALRFVHRRA